MIFGRSPRTWKILWPPAPQHHLAGADAACKQNVSVPTGSEAANPRSSLRGFNPLLLWKRPTFTAATVFLLILSGPPRLRIREAEASLRGDVDWVVLLHIVVWAFAGLWVLCQIGMRFHAKRPLLRIRWPQILGFAMICGLAVSITVSDAPVLTAFKVYQMSVSMLFTQIFLERFGIGPTLKLLLWGSTLLCIAIALCAFLAPDMVWTASDFNPEPSRLFGELIAQTGIVSVFAMILLLTSVPKIWRALPLSLFALFLVLLGLSLMRTAYVAILIFFLLILLKRPNIKPLLRFTYLLCGFVFLLGVYHRLPNVSEYRDPQTISTLSDRTGLWHYLADVTFRQSPWFGLGYYSASRVYAPEYNPGLGTAHSMFLEVLAGGGIISFVPFLVLCISLSVYAARLLLSAKDRFSFAVSTLFIATLLFGAMADEIDSGPVAMSFWCAVAILPRLYESYWRRASRSSESSTSDFLTLAGHSEQALSSQ